MATQSVPGTAVPAGAAIGPAGGFGAQGNPGPAGGAGPAGSLGNEDVGSIKAWPTPTPPPSWMIMDNSAISRTLYPDLFALIGTTFGTGDGSTTFNLPDARGSFILSVGNSGVAGSTTHALGDSGGEEKHSLVAAENANHTHTATQPAHTHTATVINSSHIAVGTTGQGPYDFLFAPTAGSAWFNGVTTSAGGDAVTVAAQGSGTGHNTMPPFLCLIYIIKVSKTGGATAQAPIANTTQPGLMNTLSGNLTDYVGGDNACHPLSANSFIVPTNEYYDQDDFTCLAAGAANIWNSKLLTCTNNGGTGPISSSIAGNYLGHPGVLQLAPGSTASGWSRAQMNGTNLYLDGNMTVKIQGVFGVATGSFAGTNQYFFGLVSPSGMGPVLAVANYYVGFFAAPNAAQTGTNWIYYSRNASTAVTQVDSGVAVGSTMTWHKFTIIAAQSQIQFFIDDNLIATVTDNSIPVGTQAINPCFFTNNGSGTNNYSMLIDCFDIWLQPVAQSGQSPTRFMRRIL